MKGKPPTFEQRQFILRIYLSQGYTAAKPWAIKYGIGLDSINRWAREAGHKGKRGREPKITPAQRAQLVEVYLKQGFQAAKPLAIEFGISPGNVCKYAKRDGRTRRHGWETAIERGAVTL